VKILIGSFDQILNLPFDYEVLDKTCAKNCKKIIQELNAKKEKVKIKLKEQKK